jgi:hypothetical protein
MVQIKLVDVSTIFYCTEFHSSKCNGSWVLFIKQNMNFGGDHIRFLNKKWSYLKVFILSIYASVQNFNVYWSKFDIHLKSAKGAILEWLKVHE